MIKKYAICIGWWFIGWLVFSVIQKLLTGSLPGTVEVVYAFAGWCYGLFVSDFFRDENV